MNLTRRLGDLELGAFADGELDSEAAGHVQNMMGDEDGARATIVWLQELQRRLHQNYDPSLAEPVPVRTQRLLRPSFAVIQLAPLRQFAALAAVVLFASFGGYALGLQQLGRESGEVRMAGQAMGAHRIFASEVEHPVEISGDDSKSLSKWLGKRLGIDFSVPIVAETGFKLIGGRLLAEADNPAGLLIYEDASGRRISLFIERWPEAGETSMRLTSAGALNSYHWIDSPLACAVSGDVASDELKNVAERIYSALNKV